jgi:hypothetical protein
VLKDATNHTQHVSNNLMKTKTDLTIAIFTICLGSIIIVPVLFSEQKLTEGVGISGIILFFLMSILGIWKLESYEINNKKIIKRNFLGIYKREYSLEKIVSLNKKFIDHDSPRNPVNILKLFTNSEKYLKFHVIICKFKGNSKMKIDSRIMSKIEFEKITKKLKLNIKLNKKKVANTV